MGAQAIEGRKIVFCPKLEAMDTDNLVETSDNCDRFFLYCCTHKTQHPDKKEPCHHYRLIFTDGAYSDNGKGEAKAGIGTAGGNVDRDWQSIPITDAMDAGGNRTSQRAELLAAIYGIDFLDTEVAIQIAVAEAKSKPRSIQDGEKVWVIATDSEYVVRGMTEWLPRWKEKNLRNAQGQKPANLDLFLRLDRRITAQEARHYVQIGFWRIGREFNGLADSLAKKATVMEYLE